MRTQKLGGSSISQFIKVGNTVFAYSEVVDHKGLSLVPDLLYQNYHPSTLIPIAFNNGSGWSISENFKIGNYMDMSIGCALNSISGDKKVRLKRDEFLVEYKVIYSKALLEEAQMCEESGLI